MFSRRKKQKTRVDDSFRSVNYDERGVCVSALVFHYTGMRSEDEALKKLCDGECENRVSAHYVVSQKGVVYGLVEERYRAWHAGVSYWRGCRDLNDCSIGIEVVNPGHEFGYCAFPRVQMEAVLGLSLDIVSRYRILEPWILGHSDISVGRKMDPGELFDWRYLAEGGVGFFPSKVADGNNNNNGVNGIERRMGILLGMMGYDCGGGDGFKKCVEAFQRRWRVGRVDGVVDGECVGIAEGVLRGWGEL